MNNTKPVNTNLQLYSKHHTNVFNSLRKSIKSTADMFLFGEPTDDMMKLLIKIYHENILRTLSSSTDVERKPNEKLQCMFGILQDEDDNLYVTISESAGMPGIGNLQTDPDYLKKKTMVINLLKSANVGIEYPEKNTSFPPVTIPDESKWRKGIRQGVSDTLPDADAIRGKIERAPVLNAANNSKLTLRDVMFYNDNKDDKVNIYDSKIRDMEMNVNWVDSVEYLRTRAAHGKTFRPFKKYKAQNLGNKKIWKAECNNGHLCTESKLFAYAFNNGLKVKSFVAYWIGKGIPPENHIIRNYCYRTKVLAGDSREEVLDEIQKLNTLTERCANVLTDPSLKDLPMLRSAIQPIAVACPGCYANIQAYMKGEMTDWNNSNCYVKRLSAPALGGTRRRTKNIRRRKTLKPKH